jgi:hypothetical protein
VIGVPNPPAGENIKAFVDLKDGFQGKMKEEEIIEWNPASSSVRGKTESGFDFLGYIPSYLREFNPLEGNQSFH